MERRDGRVARVLSDVVPVCGPRSVDKLLARATGDACPARIYGYSSRWVADTWIDTRPNFAWPGVRLKPRGHAAVRLCYWFFRRAIPDATGMGVLRLSNRRPDAALLGAPLPPRRGFFPPRRSHHRPSVIARPPCPFDVSRSVAAIASKANLKSLLSLYTYAANTMGQRVAFFPEIKMIQNTRTIDRSPRFRGDDDVLHTYMYDMCVCVRSCHMYTCIHRNTQVCAMRVQEAGSVFLLIYMLRRFSFS